MGCNKLVKYSLSTFGQFVKRKKRKIGGVHKIENVFNANRMKNVKKTAAC